MGFDRISQLPDPLLTQILLWLPTKYSIRTSVLSSRWKNLWLNVPGLDLHSDDFDWFSKSAMKNFSDRFLDINLSRLERFRIKYDECNIYLFDIEKLIATVINRGVQHLDVDTLRCPFAKDFMPVDIYKSKTLVSLKLVNVGLSNPEFEVSLPCLKIMHLENVLCCSDDPLILEKLIAGCSVLEDLTLCRAFDDSAPVLRVRSQSLKRFCVRFGPKRGLDGGVEYVIEIDCPSLKYMNFGDDQSERVVAKNLSSLIRIKIDTTFNVKLGGTLEAEDIKKRDIVCDFLIGLSSVRYMCISQRTLEVLSPSLIPKFQNLSHLEATFSGLLSQVLPPFLHSCPNLKHLILNLDNFWEPKQLASIASVPQCLVSTLECIEIKNVIKREFAGMEVVKYFLETSEVLKKLIFCFKDSPITNLQDSDFYMKIRNLTKRSRKCEISFR